METVLSSRKGTLEVEWEMARITSPLSASPNLYRITILSPSNRPNVTLIINDKPVSHIVSQMRTFDFDFTIYGTGELKATLLVFDNTKAGASTKTVDVVPVSGISPAPKK